MRTSLLRPRPTRKQRKRILIALEDERSARLYFESWGEQLRTHLIEIAIAPHTGSAPKSVVEAAKSMKEDADPEDPFNEVWVVFDTEGPQNYKRNQDARAAIEQARALNYKTAISNPSWEYWLLLHFEYFTGTLANGAAARNRLKENGIPDYHKGDNCFDKVWERTATALEHAKRLFKERWDPQELSHPCDCHPCTEVHRLIESLLSNQ